MCGEPFGLAGQDVRLMGRTRGSMTSHCHRHVFWPKRSMIFLPHELCGLTTLKIYLILKLFIVRRVPGGLRGKTGKSEHKKQGDRMAREIRIRIPEEHYRTLRELAIVRRVSLSALASGIIEEKLTEKRSFEERVLEEIGKLRREKDVP